MYEWLRQGLFSRPRQLETEIGTRPPNFRSCKVVAVTNQKGGSFKTGWTVCYSRMFVDSPLTYRIYGRFPRVAVVGLDPSCALEKAFGIDPSSVERDKSGGLPAALHHPEVDGISPIPASRIVQRFHNIHLYPATPRLSSYDSDMEALRARYVAERESGDDSRAEQSVSRLHEMRLLLKRFIDAIRDQYDRIVLDCRPGDGQTILAALFASDWVHIPTLLSDASIAQARRRAELVNQVKAVNPSLEIMAVIPTNLHRGNAQQLRWLHELSRKPTAGARVDLAAAVVPPIWYNPHIDKIIESAHTRVYRRPLQNTVGVTFKAILDREESGLSPAVISKPTAENPFEGA